MVGLLSALSAKTKALLQKLNSSFEIAIQTQKTLFLRALSPKGLWFRLRCLQTRIILFSCGLLAVRSSSTVLAVSALGNIIRFRVSGFWGHEFWRSMFQYRRLGRMKYGQQGSWRRI